MDHRRATYRMSLRFFNYRQYERKVYTYFESEVLCEHKTHPESSALRHQKQFEPPIRIRVVQRRRTFNPLPSKGASRKKQQLKGGDYL